MTVCELFDNPSYTYETSLETQAPGDREWECHISSSGQKLQQQGGGTMVQTEVPCKDEDQQKARSTELGKQGAWMKWGLPERKFTWAKLWRKDQLGILFLLRSVYDTLSSPVQLHASVGASQKPEPKLCGKRGTMAHVHSIRMPCSTDLGEIQMPR